MSKSKRGPALFDLIEEQRAKTGDVLKVPSWWGKGFRSPASAGKAKPASPPSQAKTPRLEPAESQPAMETSSEAQSVSFAELDGDRIRLSFTSVTAAVAVFIILVMILAGIEMGRRSGIRAGFKQGYAAGRASYEAETVSEIELAKAQPPAVHLVESLLKDAVPAVPGPTPHPATASTDGSPAGEAPRWVRGHTYIVAQEFSAGREADAAKAQAFLARHGLETELVRYAGGSTQLISLRGFQLRDTTQRRMAEELKKKIHTVGEKYYASRGGYRLKGYFKTLKGDHW